MNLFIIIAIVGIVLIVVVALTLVICGQIKVRQFRKCKAKFTKQWEEIATQTTIVEQKIPYTLPAEECCYFFQKAMLVQHLSTKQATQNELHPKEILNYERKWIFLQGIFNLKPTKHNKAENAIVYITNKRILFQFPDYNAFFYYEDIVQITASIFNERSYRFGALIFSNKQIYKIYLNDPLFVFLSRKFWKQTKHHSQ